MVVNYINIVLRLVSLGLVIAAAGLWTAAGVDTRPKYRDEQTLVAGTIWSQIIIPIGLMISISVGENLNQFVHAYFLISGIILLILTACVLIVGEIKALHRHRVAATRTPVSIPTPTHNSYNLMYFGIGGLTLLAAIVITAEFLVLVFR